MPGKQQGLGCECTVSLVRKVGLRGLFKSLSQPGDSAAPWGSSLAQGRYTSFH